MRHDYLDSKIFLTCTVMEGTTVAGAEAASEEADSSQVKVESPLDTMASSSTSIGSCSSAASSSSSRCGKTSSEAASCKTKSWKE